MRMERRGHAESKFFDHKVRQGRPQNRHAFSAFALRYILRLSSCRLMEGFITSPLPHLVVEELRLSMAPSLHPHYRTSQLLRAAPSSCCLRPLSRVRSYRAYHSPRISPRAIRTSPVSIVSLLPCRRHYPTGVNYPLSHSEIAHAVFTSIEQVRPPDSNQS